MRKMGIVQEGGGLSITSYKTAFFPSRNMDAELPSSPLNIHVRLLYSNNILCLQGWRHIIIPSQLDITMSLALAGDKVSHGGFRKPTKKHAGVPLSVLHPVAEAPALTVMTLIADHPW